MPLFLFSFLLFLFVFIDLNYVYFSGTTQTWISAANSVPTQIIRAPNITQSPRQKPRITQTSTSNLGNQTTNISSVGQSVCQNSQTFTLATVLPQRQQAATLVYPPTQQYQTTGQRLAVASNITHRQARPIQIGARLPSAMGLRVSAANISIRAPSVPVLAPTSVLTSISNTAQGRSGVTASTTNLSTGIPATRIIQVQQQQSGTAQVLNTTRLPGNLMTLHPVIMSASGTGNRIPSTIGAKVQPSLTITHVKSAMGQQPSNTAGTIVTQNTQQSTQSGANQHMQLVSVNQQGQVLNQGHQIVTVSQQQLIAAQNQQQSGIATVVPLSINTRTTNALTATMTSISGNIRGANVAPVSTGTTILPIAKVLPQQQQNQLVAEIQQHQQTNNTTSANVTNQQILLHARSPSTSGAVTSVSVGGGVPSNVGSFIPSGGTYFYEHVANSSSGNTVLTLTQTSSAPSMSNAQQNSVNTSNIVTSVNYTPTGGGSFAVVPTNNRNINQMHSEFLNVQYSRYMYGLIKI